MTKAQEPHVLIVLHLVGGNDALNTLIPYGDPLYYDNRPVVHIPEAQVLHIDNHFGFHPSVAALKPFYDQGKMAIIMGIGYPNRNYSHFRSTDIWETAEPEKIVASGWLGKAVREIDPKADNVLTAVNFGRGLPRALSLTGVPIASVAQLDSYGLFTNLVNASQRQSALDVFSHMYDEGHSCHGLPPLPEPSFVEQMGEVLRYTAQTGLAALKGADILRTTAGKYNSTVHYPKSPIAEKLKGIAQIKLANLGTRIFYTSHGSFDLHAIQLPNHSERWLEISQAVSAFFEDLRSHDAAGDVILFMWSEFGRRVKDNGGGTDHGAAGLAFIIGDQVKGGMYGEYPSLRNADLIDGNLKYHVDFRMVYGSLLEHWLQVDALPIVGAPFEQIAFV